jgi:hypothetical protein
MSAKEIACTFVGKFGLPVIVTLVCAGIFSALMLPSEALTPVIGLVTTVTMAVIALMNGVTGTIEKPDRPEFDVIKTLIDKNEPMEVTIEGDKVTVTKGADKISTKANS